MLHQWQEMNRKQLTFLINSFHFHYVLYPDRAGGGSGVYPGNVRSEHTLDVTSDPHSTPYRPTCSHTHSHLRSIEHNRLCFWRLEET